MAASASLSSPFSLYSTHSFSLPSSSSRPTNQLSLQHTLVFSGKPISGKPLPAFPVLNAYGRFGNSKIINDGYQNYRASSFRPSTSAHQENQPNQATKDEADKKLPSLKSLIQAYKEAIFTGDREAVYAIENMIFIVEKEKNELDQKVLALSSEISSGKEKYLRLQADFENYRKRAEKERLTARSDAQGEVIESLLPMVDSFERAKQQIKLETEKEKKIDTSYQGIYKQFVEIMRSLRVAVVPTVGKPFDPLMHEAIAREESLEFKEGIIIQEFRRGFYLGDRLLRPAMVKVSSGPGKTNSKNSPSVPDQSSEQPASVTGIDS